MKVKLLKNVIENGGVKVARRRQQADGSYLVEVPFVAGTVIEMSDASAAKYIADGLAEELAVTAAEDRA
jgi:hypothetical protein